MFRHAFKFFISVKQKPVSMMRFQDFASHLLGYTHHLWVEITNPVHLQISVLEFSFTSYKIRKSDNQSSFHAFALKFRNNTKQRSKGFVNATGVFIVKK